MDKKDNPNKAGSSGNQSRMESNSPTSSDDEDEMMNMTSNSENNDIEYEALERYYMGEIKSLLDDLDDHPPPRTIEEKREAMARKIEKLKTIVLQVRKNYMEHQKEKADAIPRYSDDSDDQNSPNKVTL